MIKLSNNKLLFINLAINSGYYGVNHGLAYLAPIAQKYSFEVSVLNIFRELSNNEFRKQIEVLNPSIVAYSFLSPQTNYLIKYSNAIEDFKHLLQIAGGVGATLFPDEILIQTPMDGFVIGEGEVPLGSLLSALKYDKNIYSIDGFYWQKSDNILINDIPQFNTNLSELEFPDYSIFDRDIVVSGSDSHINLMLSRGCPYTCTYCSNQALRSTYASSKGYFRVPSVDYSIRLIESVVNQYPETRFINFEDDLLIANRDWFLDFSREYLKRIGIPYRVNVRTECISSDIVDALKSSACTFAMLGLESGNEAYRKTYFKRYHSNSEIINNVRILKNAGIRLFTYNMVGLPFESKRHMQNTLSINKAIGAGDGQCTFFYPFPKTELYNICKENNLLIHKDLKNIPTNYNTRPFIRQSAKQKSDCIKAQKKITNYLKWQDLKYRHRDYCSEHRGPSRLLFFLRLLAIYLLRKFSSPYKNNSLFRYFYNNKYQKRLSNLFRI